MQEYFQNNIYLLFLPSYTSYILQPLDLTIFTVLKRTYRKQLGTLALLNDSTPISKQNFLECYKLARIDALISTNYKQGFSASGLQLVRPSKPLLNRLLLENSNKPVEQTLITSGKDLVLKQNQSKSLILQIIPKKSEDIRVQALQITGLGEADSTTTRILFRKVAKGLDEKDFVIAQHELRIKQLEARVQQLQPRKRRKVQTSPNSKFAGIEDIYKVQIVVRDQ